MLDHIESAKEMDRKGFEKKQVHPATNVGREWLMQWTFGKLKFPAPTPGSHLIGKNENIRIEPKNKY